MIAQKSVSLGRMVRYGAFAAVFGLSVNGAGAETTLRLFSSKADAPFAGGAVPYDPVARAIALGLTPEQVDAVFDRGLSSAERCPTGAAASEMPVIGCHDLRMTALLPPLS